MAFQAHRGIRRIVNALVYSLEGCRAAYNSEEAFRQECLLALVFIPLGLWLGDSGFERALLVGVVLLVLVVELLNSGIEAVVDRIGPDIHELSKRAKDVGSAAVLVSLINAATVWILTLLF